MTGSRISMVWVLVLCFGCDETRFSGGGGSSLELDGDFCSVEVIFDNECTSCHSASGQMGGLDLETHPYQAIFEASSVDPDWVLVSAGSSEQSLLYQVMAGTQPSEMSSMPIGESVDLEFAEVVREWIDAGAEPCGAVSDDTGSDTGAAR